jgi:transaldolase
MVTRKESTKLEAYMEIWLDTANLDLIASATKMGILHGVTTNPSIVSKSGLVLEELLEKILAEQKGPVTAQVTATSVEQMMTQARALHAFSPRILVKIPVTADGLKAIHGLNQEQIPTMATAVFDLNQTLLAARAGASYIAPYFSRICEDDMDGIEVVKAMLRLLHRYNFPSKLIAASLGSSEQVRECAEMGAHAVTLNEKVFHDFLENHPSTMESIERFTKDWKGAKKGKKLPF